MNKIIAKKYIHENLLKFEIKVSASIREIKPGQYVIFRIEETGSRIPLTVSKVNVEKETIQVFVPITDANTRQFADLIVGRIIFGIDGPFGTPVKTEHFGTVLCISRELGIVPLLPILTSLRASGNRVITILSAQSNDGIILEAEIREASDDVIILTEDGSCGNKGSICQEMRKILTYSKINQVFAIGSAKTIKETCSLTRKYNIATQALLYTPKAEEGGLNGLFRVSICCAGKSVCVDGANFNAYYNDFDEMVRRFESNNSQKNQTVGVMLEANLSA